MKDFADNLKAFAAFVVTLFKSGDDETTITAGEFAQFASPRINAPFDLYCTR